ncbi:hypothetical protein A0H81_09304 [Grifola frondosa]|uniref:Uncharacterized protein n=1 Tax=Grifola frondosa TaxID=5627 RepID=A0A1C7M374_GRIFR|nr:hypothetical protein A0H81_09304 [Grifola frondosa]
MWGTGRYHDLICFRDYQIQICIVFVLSWSICLLLVNTHVQRSPIDAFSCCMFADQMRGFPMVGPDKHKIDILSARQSSDNLLSLSLFPSGKHLPAQWELELPLALSVRRSNAAGVKGRSIPLFSRSMTAVFLRCVTHESRVWCLSSKFPDESMWCAGQPKREGRRYRAAAGQPEGGLAPWLGEHVPAYTFRELSTETNVSRTLLPTTSPSSQNDVDIAAASVQWRI